MLLDASVSDHPVIGWVHGVTAKCHPYPMYLRRVGGTDAVLACT